MKRRPEMAFRIALPRAEVQLGRTNPGLTKEKT